MFSVLGVTSLDLSERKKHELITALNEAGKSVFPEDFYLSLRFTKAEYCTKSVDGLIQCAGIASNDITYAQKAEFVKVMCAAAAAAVKDARFLILFWETEPKDIHH